MNTASTEYLHRSTYEPLEARKNQNEVLLQEDALIFCCTVSTYLHPQILPWLHIHLQSVKVRSIALTVAFSEQMCQVECVWFPLQSPFK